MPVQLLANLQTRIVSRTVLPWLSGYMAQLVAACQLQSSDKLARHSLSHCSTLAYWSARCSYMMHVCLQCKGSLRSMQVVRQTRSSFSTQ